MSEANVCYSNKGNPLKLRAHLDQAKKDDLRANHFEIGGNTAAFKQPVSKLEFRPATAAQRTDARAALNEDKKRDLRASHWTVGQSSTPCLSAAGNGRNNNYASKTLQPAGQRPGSAFVTSAMVNYKWIQPYPSQIV